MEFIVGLIIIAVIALIVWIRWLVKRTWKRIEAGQGEIAEEIRIKYQHLETNQIRCKMKTVDSGDIVPAGGMSESILQLYVHRQDYEKAMNLLDDFEPEIETV